jgi:hypothetical protein
MLQFATNSIALPDQWPPRPATFARDQPLLPPYLANPPKVIPIDGGRQLFVDDFLVERTALPGYSSSRDTAGRAALESSGKRSPKPLRR